MWPILILEDCNVFHCIFKRVARYPMLILVKYDEQNSRVSDSNTISEPFQRGWAKIRIRSVSPRWLWRCRSSGHRQLCSLWFEYDLCLNRKPPSDHKSCLMTLIRIRSTSDPKGLSYDSNMIKKPPSGFGSMPIKWVSTAMFSLVRIRPMLEQEAPKWSRLDSDMIITGPKESRIQIWSASPWLSPPPDKENT